VSFLGKMILTDVAKTKTLQRERERERRDMNRQKKKGTHDLKLLIYTQQQ
jgi:hypothetical protein